MKNIIFCSVLFCSVLFCSISTFSGCGVCCCKKRVDPWTDDFFLILPVDYHKYDKGWPEGFYFINFEDHNKKYFINTEGKLYSIINDSPSDMQEVTYDENNQQSEKFYACVEDCAMIGQMWGIYYNGTFEENIDIAEYIRILNEAKGKNLFSLQISPVAPDSIFFDSAGTIILLKICSILCNEENFDIKEEGLQLLIRKNNISFLQNFKPPWADILSKESCEKCFPLSFEFDEPDNKRSVFRFCPMCGKEEENFIIDKNTSFLSKAQFLEKLSSMIQLRGFLKKYGVGKKAKEEIQKKFPPNSKEWCLRQALLGSGDLRAAFLWGKPLYSFLKEKWKNLESLP